MQFSLKKLAKCALPVLMLGLLPGCSTVLESTAWKKTSNFYYTYVNRPVEMDFSTVEALPAGESRLASKLMSLDWQLTSLEHSLEGLGNTPDQGTAELLLREYPWLSGVSLIDASGNLFAAVPSAQLKQLDFTPLLEAPVSRPLRSLRGAVQDTPLGPEIMLAAPILQEAEIAGFFVVSFDFRSLLPYAGAADNIVVRAPEVTLWSGDRMYDETPLAAEDWGKVLAHQSYGTVGSGAQEMVWIARYLGSMPLVFAGSAAPAADAD